MIDRAVVDLRVDVLVVVTKNAAESLPIEHSLSYAFSGDSSEVQGSGSSSSYEDCTFEGEEEEE